MTEYVITYSILIFRSYNLFDLEKHCNFLNQLNHENSKYLKSRPDNSTLIAAIIAYGCNIGSHKMGHIKPSTLQTTANWFLNKALPLQSIDLIVSLTNPKRKRISNKI